MGKNSEAASPLDPLERLSERCSRKWPAITKARKFTSDWLQKLEALQKFSSDNTSIVVFGSLARGEFTSGSDVDWSLLIDGPSDPEHFRVAQEVHKQLISLSLPKPGTTETFGSLASSHELIHHVGGVRDTNQNMTRRILLLLKSLPLTNAIVHERVVRGILNRYISYGVSVSWQERGSSSETPLVPRFLLNDIVRFWRTMAVDYAAKQWEQSDKKWALRNAKLRLSRKLLFAAGLLLCFNFELISPDDRQDIISDPDTLRSRMTDFLLEQMRFSPVDRVCLALLQDNRETVAIAVMDSYDRFLSILARHPRGNADARPVAPADRTKGDRRLDRVRVDWVRREAGPLQVERPVIPGRRVPVPGTRQRPPAQGVQGRPVSPCPW